MKDAEQRMIPDALSHRDLAGLLQGAPREMEACASDVDPLSDELKIWAEQTQHLLQRISAHGDAVAHGRSPQQVMALGSFCTHLVMGLKALRYSES